MTVDVLKSIAESVRNSTVESLTFVKGAALGEDFFVIRFGCGLRMEVYSGFRVLSGSKVLLRDNDLYLDREQDLLSEKRLRRTAGIAETYLSVTLKQVNADISGRLVKDMTINAYGDVKIHLQNDIFLEIMIESHQEDVLFYTILHGSRKYSVYCKNFTPTLLAEKERNA